MHAKALSDPAYIVKQKDAEAAIKGLGAFCNTCHGPVATMTGELVKGTLSAQSADAIGCDFCHQVTGSATPPGNTSQSLTLDGTKRAQLKDSKSSTHKTAYSAFHQTAEFCGACHNVNHPVNGMHLEATYAEWKAGPYGVRGITCQDCHMTPGPGVVKPNPGTAAAGGPQRQNIYTMTFVGANVAQGDAARATANLQAAAKLELEVPEIIETGGSGLVTVTITNVGAGHYLPTGLTEVRQMWLEVNAVDADGTSTQVGRRDFGTVLKDAHGKYPAELWAAVGVQSDDRIPPLQSVTQAYKVAMPNTPSAKIVATLNYRSLPDEMASEAKVENPVTEMEKVEQTVWSSAEARDGTSEQEASGGSSPLLIVVAVVVVLAIVGGVGYLLARRRRVA